MARILNKAISPGERRENGAWAMGIVVSSLGGAHRPQSIYLDGYGALFLANVKFPLVAPPPSGSERPNEPEDTDSEWEQAREEIFGTRETRFEWKGTARPEAPGMQYDPDRVTELKKNVLDALKNANNIRHLKPEEYITVAITGTDSQPGTPVRRIYKNSAPGTGSKTRVVDDVVTVLRSGRRDPLAAESHLTIRVKKSDVEAFAKGRISFEKFEKTASIVTY